MSVCGQLELTDLAKTLVSRQAKHSKSSRVCWVFQEKPRAGERRPIGLDSGLGVDDDDSMTHPCYIIYSIIRLS